MRDTEAVRLRSRFWNKSDENLWQIQENVTSDISNLAHQPSCLAWKMRFIL